MPKLQGVDAGEERRHPAAGLGRRKKRDVSETSLLPNGQARSSRQQPATHAALVFPPCRRTGEAVNLPGTGLHRRCNGVSAQRGSRLIFFTGNQTGEVSASPRPAATTRSLEAPQASQHPHPHAHMLSCMEVHRVPPADAGTAQTQAR